MTKVALTIVSMAEAVAVFGDISALVVTDHPDLAWAIFRIASVAVISTRIGLAQWG